mgnify:CR=1 FL=1
MNDISAGGKIRLGILFVAIVLGVYFLATECFTSLIYHIKHPVGRFQPVTNTMALDTTTGKLCYAFDPIGAGSDRIPLCSNLK